MLCFGSWTLIPQLFRLFFNTCCIVPYIIYGLQVSLKLDIAQDKIMLANTRLSVAVVMIGFAAYFTGTYVRLCALYLQFL